MPTPKASDTLLSYLRVQENFDRQLYAVLQRAASDAEKQITALAGKQGIGAVIRREQVAAVKKALHTQMADTLEREGFIIGAGYERAAAAAITTFEAYDKMLMGSIFDDEQVQAYLRSARQTSRIGIDAARQRLLGTSYIPLSEQVYKTTQLTNGMVDRLVESALTRGLSARELAREVRDFIQPNVQGGVSYAALRLARTEINNAFHAVQAEKARTTPWITGLQWNISGSHPDLDECDEYANEQHFHGGEPGVFLPEEIPMKPHPQCLCFTTPVTVSQDVFLDSFFAGEYDTYIDDVIENGGTSGMYGTGGRVTRKAITAGRSGGATTARRSATPTIRPPSSSRPHVSMDGAPEYMQRPLQREWRFYDGPAQTDTMWAYDYDGMKAIRSAMGDIRDGKAVSESGLERFIAKAGNDFYTDGVRTLSKDDALAALDQAARDMLTRQPVPLPESVYRGMWVRADDDFYVGADIKMDFSSWTSNVSNVTPYTAKTELHNFDDGVGIIMELKNGRGFAISPNPDWDEMIVSGSIRITDVTTLPNGIRKVVGEYVTN